MFAGSAECFPLISLLTALNQTVVDYFSLDIEGMELNVLKQIPFDKLTLKASKFIFFWSAGFFK